MVYAPEISGRWFYVCSQTINRHNRPPLVESLRVVMHSLHLPADPWCSFQQRLTHDMCRIDEHTLLWRVDQEVLGESKPAFKLHFSKAGALEFTGKH